jgi:hypothetical protein
MLTIFERWNQIYHTNTETFGRQSLLLLECGAAILMQHIELAESGWLPTGRDIFDLANRSNPAEAAVQWAERSRDIEQRAGQVARSYLETWNDVQHRLKLSAEEISAQWTAPWLAYARRLAGAEVATETARRGKPLMEHWAHRQAA